MMQNENIMVQPLRKAREEERTEKLIIRRLTPSYGVLWFKNPKADVVDVELGLPNGNNIMQRETFSYSTRSNLGKLVRVALGKPEDEYMDKVDLNEIIGKEVIGDITHWSNARGDVYEKVKNFRSVYDNQSQDSLEDNQAGD